MANLYLGDEHPESREYADNYFYFDGSDPLALSRTLEKLNAKRFAGSQEPSSQCDICRSIFHATLD